MSAKWRTRFPPCGAMRASYAEKVRAPTITISNRDAIGLEGAVKLWGQISVELNVEDFVEAADHQKRLEDMLRLVRASYPEATLAMRERRQRRSTPVVRARPPALGTGRLNDYAEG